MGDHTASDAAIAAALAQQEQEHADAELLHQFSAPPVVQGRSVDSPFSYPGDRRRTAGTAPRSSSSPPRSDACPGGCGGSLRSFSVSPAQRVHCNACGRRLNPGEPVHSCTACDYDVCDACRNGVNGSGGGNGSGRSSRAGGGSGGTSSSPFQSPPFSMAARPTSSPHMCEVACIVGDGICVEMMVDSGAQTSVISSTLARTLGLESRIDRREMGVAAGVGRARIVGRIRNVVCTLGNVEFDMDFVVLEVPDKLLLLGLDQLRRFKCIIDLEREVLVFGGQGGVDVPMLPPSEQHVDWRNALGSPCTVA